MPVPLSSLLQSKRKLLLPLFLFLCLSTLIPATLFASHNLDLVVDADGPDDVPDQSDLSQMGLDTTHLSDSNPFYQLFWSFDDTVYPGSNSGDGCAFFDSDDSGGFADFALCTSFETVSNQLQLTAVTLYDCNNSEPSNDEGARCHFKGGGGDGSSAVIGEDTNDDGQLEGKNSFCTLNTTTTTDPFNGISAHNTSNQQDPIKDTGVSCTIFVNELKEADGDVPTGIGLSNVCSFTSPDPNSERKDCIVKPGSGFLIIRKVATPNDGTTFAFTRNSQPLTTIQGSGSSAPIPVEGGILFNLAETVPNGWQLDSATCSNNNSPSALTVPAGQTVTCTFTNSIIPNPAYIISKRAVIADGGAAVNQAGDIINYTITLTNTGNVNLTGVVVSDPLLGGVLSGPASQSLTVNITLEVNEVWTYIGSYAVQQSDLDNNGGSDGDIDNTASATTTQLPTPKTASAAVPLARAPALAMEKRVVSVKNPNGSFDPLLQVDQAGDLITYTIVVTNTGNVTLHNVTVDDNLAGVTNLPCAASLALGAACSVQVSYSVTQLDLDNNGGNDGDIDNTATADSDETDNLHAEAMVPLFRKPALAAVKSVVSVTNPGGSVDTPPQVDQTGDKILYEILVTNTGNQTLHNVIVDDNLTGTVNKLCAATLAPGDSCTVTVIYTATQADIDTAGGGDGDIDNIATADSNETDSLDTEAMVPVVQRPALAVTKDVLRVTNPNSSLDPLTQVDQAGDVVTYAITVTNSGNQTLHNVLVDDDLTGTVDRKCADTLLPGASCTVIVNYTATQTDIDTNGGSDGEINNTATAAADEADPESDDATVPVLQLPSMQIAKTPDLQTVFRGDIVTFTITITNDGNLTLTDVTVSDPNAPNCSRRIGTLAVGAVDSYQCQSATLLTGFTNVATVSAKEKNDPVADDAVVRVADLAISKSPDLQVIQSGATVAFTITVENTGEVDLTNVVVTDALAPACNRTFVTLVVGASQEYTCTLTAVTATFVNTAIADADQTPPIADTATVQVANLTINKSANPTSLPEPGGRVTFTVDIQNTASTTLTLTALNDAPFGDITQTNDPIVATTCVLPWRLAPAGNLQGFRYTCSFTVQLRGEPNNYLDIVTATLQDRHDNQIRISDDATVTITDQTPTVALAKAVSPESRLEPGGDFLYTLTVTNTAVEPVTIAALSDSWAAPPTDFSECAKLVGKSLLPNQSVSCQYIVKHTEAGTYPNTATVQVTDNEQNSASANASKQITVDDALPTVTLQKSASPASRVEPGGSFVFTLTVTNTAVEPVKIIALTDDHAALAITFEECAALVNQTLAPNQSVSCQYTVFYADANVHTNRATVTVQDNERHTAFSEASERVTIDDTLPRVTLTKAATPQRLIEPGGDFLFTLSVTNDSVELVTIDALSDSQQAEAADFSECARLVGQQLAPGQSRSCQYTITHANAGAYPNRAEVMVSDNEEKQATADAMMTVTVDDLLPRIRVNKGAQPGAILETGGNVLFLVEVYNTGVEPLTLTALNDDHFGDLKGVGNCVVPQTIAPNGVYRCTFTKTISGRFGEDHRNTVTATVNDDDGNTTTDSDDATVTFIDVNPNLQVTKDDKRQVDADGNGVVSPGDTLRYIITVINTGNGTAFDTYLTDIPDPQTRLVTGTVVTSKGIVRVGNGAGDTAVEVEIGDIAPNGAERVQIIFDVVINPQITQSLVRNQAVVTTIAGQNEPPTEEPSDDPATSKIDDETITEVYFPTAEDEVDEPIGSAIRRLFLPLINKR